MAGNAKTYLQRIKQIDDEIEYQIEEINRLRDMLTRITPVMKDDVVSGSGFQDKISSGVAKIVDLQDRINRNVDAYADLKSEVLKQMAKMERKDYAKVLHLRYFQYKTWEEIAAEMKYSYRGACYLHGRALVEFEKVMKEGDDHGNDAEVLQDR